MSIEEKLRALPERACPCGCEVQMDALRAAARLAYEDAVEVAKSAAYGIDAEEIADAIRARAASLRGES